MGKTMAFNIPRTVKAVDADQLLQLDAEAVACGLNRHHGVEWLTEYAEPTATHYLHPILAHRLNHRPELSLHWRCMLLLAVRGGEQVFSLLDVLPASFDSLAENLSAETKKEIIHKLNHECLPTQAEWNDRHG
ncbi:hypothetical protein [Nonomuraea helvata]|uniref:Uncharacterized protein n=1 Tax=Nonomuraea helvata TaxID=37484 RepID=A0ABV5SFM5_9ACTN